MQRRLSRLGQLNRTPADLERSHSSQGLGISPESRPRLANNGASGRLLAVWQEAGRPSRKGAGSQSKTEPMAVVFLGP